MPGILLVTTDNVTMEIPRDVVRMSEYLCAELQKQEHDVDDETDDEIDFQPCIKVAADSATMKIIIEWGEHHKNDVTPTKKKNRRQRKNEKVPEWDQKFFEVDQSILFTVVKAANALAFKSLTDILCKIVAGMLKGKTTEEMRTIFHIKNDFTPEEEEEIKRENERIIAEEEIRQLERELHLAPRRRRVKRH